MDITWIRQNRLGKSALPPGPFYRWHYPLCMTHFILLEIMFLIASIPLQKTPCFLIVPKIRKRLFWHQICGSALINLNSSWHCKLSLKNVCTFQLMFQNYSASKLCCNSDWILGLKMQGWATYNAEYVNNWVVNTNLDNRRHHYRFISGRSLYFSYYFKCHST